MKNGARQPGGDRSEYSVFGTQYSHAPAPSPALPERLGFPKPPTKEASCHFCGLPVRSTGRPAETLYCCYGCRFASSVAAADGDEGQNRWAMTRLGLGVFFSMTVMVFTMLLWSEPGAAEPFAVVWYDLARYACMFFTLPVIFLLGGPLVEDALVELRGGRASLSLLLVVGIAAALAYSAWSIARGTGHVYFEVACTVLVAVTLGRWLEAAGKLQTTAALRGLKQLLPDTVRLVGPNGQVDEEPASALMSGGIFRVLPGERVVADGQVIANEAAVDEQAITGESLPVIRRSGDRVLSGTLVIDGPLDIRAVASPGEGTLACMVEAVASATARRTQIERLAERISRWFLPVVAVVAVLAISIHTCAGDFGSGLLAAVAVLIIACPCALGLATPMALWAAVGRAAGAGVLIRDGDALASLAKSKILCFDKTGTLTTGEAQVERLETYGATDERVLLGAAVALGRTSNHPLALAVTNSAGRFSLTSSAAVQNAVTQAGYGIAGRISTISTTAYLGSRRWMAVCGQRLPSEEMPTGTAAQEDAAETLMGWGGLVRGRFVIRERARPEVETTIALLRRMGCTCVMLTGDREPRALALATSLGLQHQAELLPKAKLDAIRLLQASGPVVMVGDGINDAPALAAADVGVALGSGSDISRHSAGVCLLTSDLSKLPWLIQLARQTQNTIRWNLLWAFGYNTLGIGIAAAGWLHPVIAAIAMAASSLLVVTNSLALARQQPDAQTAEFSP